MPFITQGKTNWKFLLIVIVLAIIVGGGALWYASNWTTKGNLQIIKSDLILFEKIETWGPCPPNNICGQLIKLYYSGKLVFEGEKNITKQLDKDTLEEIKSQIKSSGIMDKECSGKFPLPDYSADYTLNFEGQIKQIRLPNCEEDLKLIDNIIEDETADWKTYRNEEYEYEIKYPKDWAFAFSEGRVASIWKLNCSLLIYKTTDNYTNKTIQDCLAMIKNYGQNFCSFTEKTINDIGFKIVGSTGGQELYFANSNSNYFYILSHDARFSFQGGEPVPEEYFNCENYFNKIISTFRFLE